MYMAHTHTQIQPHTHTLYFTGRQWITCVSAPDERQKDEQNEPKKKHKIL